PADPSEGMLLVRATATLRDGTRLAAFLTPAFEPDDIATVQPQVFAGGRLFSFWGGLFGIPEEGRREFYAAVGKAAADVFPLDVAADPAVAGGVARVTVNGFYKTSGSGVEVVR
ncbi:MAG TPA: hypothetical protein VFO85_15950, partial [Vicinamibacteria bacterium]|nr:hypothetical protein [Vicinamibacteria bacterium]